MDGVTQSAPLVAGAGAATLAEQLAAMLGQRIRQRLLAPGARLPSVREGAARYGVSPSTVISAYDRLQAQGLVQARPQRGFFVREPVAPGGGRALHGAHSARGPHDGGGAREQRVAPVDATALIRGMFQARHRHGAPGSGMLPESWLDPALLQRALRRVGRGDAGRSWLSYGDPAGDPRLRDALSRRLADLGVRAAPEQIVTTVGATHGLDIVARTLLAPGDAVLVDEPGWGVEFARLARLGMRLLPVPRGPDGPDLAVMEQLARAHRPRLYVTVPVLHNPTGQSLAAACAHQLLLLAARHDFVVVEDDTYAWLAAPHAPRVAQLDGLERTVYVSGFSKFLVPQWRVGFVAAAPALVDRLVDTKLLATLTTPAPLEQALAWCLDQGALRRHGERLNAQLATARARCVRTAREAGFAFATPPQGLFGWLDVGIDTDRAAQQLLDEGWLSAPGSLFHAVPRPSPFMRVNFATALDPRWWHSLRRVRDGARVPRPRATPAHG
jgi:DNA-binding transcriptional MocR family regulator